MIIIEVVYTDEDTSEIIDLVLEEEINNYQKENKDIFLSITGSNECCKRVIGLANDKGIDSDNIIYFGKTKLNSNELDLIYMFFAFSKDFDTYTKVILSDNSRIIFDNSTSLTKSIGNIWLRLEHIQKSSTNGELFSLKKELNEFKNIIKKDYTVAISSAVSKSITLIQNIVDLEVKFFTGFYKQDYMHIISQSESKDLLSFDMSDILMRYKTLNKSLCNYSISLSCRIEYISALEHFKKLFLKSIEDKTLPLLMIWFASYFILCSVFHKRNSNYSAGLAMAVRALELYCKAILVSKGCGDYDGRGKFIQEVDDKGFLNKWVPVNGVGPLWKSVEVYVKENDCTKSIWNSIKLRNKSVFGHGVAHIDEDSFNYAYSNISSIIKNSAECNADNSKLWDGLQKVGIVNIVKNSGN